MSFFQEKPPNPPIRDTNQTIVLIEDDPDTAEMLILVFRFETSYRIVRFESGEDLLSNLETVKALQPALLILDYRLPGMNALELYEQLSKQEPFVPIPSLLITATRIYDPLIEESSYPLTLLHKPFSIDELLRNVRALIQRSLSPSGT